MSAKKPIPDAIAKAVSQAQEVLNPDGHRSVNYGYMYDMKHGRIRAYGDSEYGDIHEIGVPDGCMVGMYRDVAVVATPQGTWIVRHRENGSMYWEDARGVSDESQVTTSVILTDHRAVQ